MTTQSCDTCQHGYVFHPFLPHGLTGWSCAHPEVQDCTEPEKPACGGRFWRKKEDE